jgi:hypothetical protein
MYFIIAGDEIREGIVVFGIPHAAYYAVFCCGSVSLLLFVLRLSIGLWSIVNQFVLGRLFGSAVKLREMGEWAGINNKPETKLHAVCTHQTMFKDNETQSSNGDGGFRF